MARKTEESLLQQLRIDDIEIARRKELFAFKPSDAALLTEARPYVVPEMDGIVEEFYRRQTEVEEIALIIGDSETLRRLRIAQRKYVDDLFSGVYDEDYVNNRLRIGLVHKRIGVEPRYYLSAVGVLKEILHNVISSRIADPAQASETKEALDKLLYLDTAFVFDTYIGSMLSEIEAARQSAMRHARVLENKVAERTRELELLSRHDPLTGLLNRHAFAEALRKEIARAKRTSSPIAVLYIDIDRLKEINDSHGHMRGDEVLRMASGILKATSREIDIAARLGGDEFCVVLPGVDEEGANAYRERFVRKMREQDAGVTVSVGVSHTGPHEFGEPETLISLADARMYEEKSRHHAEPPAQPRDAEPGRAA